MWMNRSKHFFRDAPAEKTAADSSKWPLASRTCAYIMQVVRPKDKVCLSLGCGWGRFLRAYFENGAKIVIGIDINKKNIFKCKNTGAELVIGDIENLPFRPNVIDAMECVATMEHIARPEKVVTELRRIIKEARGVAFITWNHYNWLKALYDHKVRMRLFWTVRDLIYELFSSIIRNTLPESAIIRKTLLNDYGLYRNEGFSFPTILQIFEKASMHIILAKYLSDENIIITCSKARKGEK
jgi:SAM-dependent methyltransferase